MVSIVVGAVILCTIHLSIGYLMGYRAGEEHGAAASKSSSPAYLGALFELLRRSNELQFRLTAHAQEVPERFALAVSDVLLATQAIRRGLGGEAMQELANFESRDASHERPALGVRIDPPACQAFTTAAATSDATVAETESHAVMPVSTDERKPYPTIQRIAFIRAKSQIREYHEEAVTPEIVARRAAYCGKTICRVHLTTVLRERLARDDLAKLAECLRPHDDVGQFQNVLWRLREAIPSGHYEALGFLALESAARTWFAVAEGLDLVDGPITKSIQAASDAASVLSPADIDALIDGCLEIR